MQCFFFLELLLHFLYFVEAVFKADTLNQVRDLW